jgi:hypothetical protein
MNRNITEEYIICSAIHYTDGNTYVHQPINIKSGIVVCGMRHHNCITTLSKLLKSNYNSSLCGRDNQGFLTSKNRYVDRKEGLQIAIKANQLIVNLHSNNEDNNNNILTSEELY